MPPIVESKWRETDAAALEERARVIDAWLEQTEDLVEMLGKDEAVVTELRSFCGLARSRKSDLINEAEKLRATV